MFDPTTLVSVVILLGILILVHEWGHFVVAKLFGVRVETFSIGFGPRIWGWKRGDTDYRLSVLPLGGYVKMAGDNPMEERAGAPDEFMSKPRWQRAIIALAGPAMNIVLALGLVTGLFTVGQFQEPYLDDPVEISGVVKGSEAEKAGLQAGDRVVEFGGVGNPTWYKVNFELVFSRPGATIPVVFLRNGELKGTSVNVSAPTRATVALPFWLLGYPSEPTVVRRVAPRSAAEEGGLEAGDVLLAMDGKPVISPTDCRARIQEAAGRPMGFRVRRGTEELTVQVRARNNDPGDGGGARWLVGVDFRSQLVRKAYPLGEATQRAFWYNARVSREILSVVANLIQGKVSIRNLGGPLEIARQSGDAARQGVASFVGLMALISLNLAILNLLPIPILDGGHILLLSIEGLLRRDLSLAVKERFVQVGMVFLLVIFAIVMYNDVLKSFR